MKPDTTGLNFLVGMLNQRDRMDQVSSRFKADRGTGFGAKSRSERIEQGFKSTYKRVAQTNARAMERAEDTESPRDEKNVRMEKGSAVIRKALISLTDKLNLDLNPALRDLQISSVSEEMLEQFAEILYSLKNISGMLDEAVANNQMLDIGSGVIGVGDAQQLSTFVHSAMFKVELGIGMLGVADQVASALAGKFDRPHTPNIPQALDPSSLSMPQAHLAKMSGNMPFAIEGVSLLVQKIRELCANVAQGQSAQMTGLVSSSGSDASVSLSSFDSQTMRRILHIDTQDAQTTNQNAKNGLMFGAEKGLAKNITANAVKPVEQMLATADANARAARMPFTLPSLGAAVASSPFRSLDETIMNQIADKLQSAARTGITEIRLHLRPESLGEVKLKIRVEKGMVSAMIQVENAQVKQTVENNLQSLKESLLAQNLEAGAMEVSISNDGMHFTEGNTAHEASSNGQEESTDTDGEEGSESLPMALGQETGRRFGDNSVEYFL